MTTDQTRQAMSREEFLQNLSSSGLSVSADVATAVKSLPADDPGQAKDLAHALVESGSLTRFQAEALLAGRSAEVQIGNYDILDKLGAGAMGTVFKARHRRMKRVVALKLMSRAVDANKVFVARFQREVEIIAGLIHPNIVMAFDADEAEAGLFLVMEFVDGRDLASIVADAGPLSVADAVDAVLQAARGLEHAHQHGMIHRDIKPANILRSVTGQIKVADLGLARLNDDAQKDTASITQAGGVLGTIDYMPPEQAEDSTTIDHRADQYSLGCTLHFLLTGRPMFTGTTVMAILLKHRDAPIPSLTAARSDVPPELDAIFRKMVAKKVNDRFANLTEVIRALEALPITRDASSSAPPVVAPGSGDHAFSQIPSSLAIHFDRTEQFSASEAAKLGPSTAGISIVLAEASRVQAGIIRKYLEQLGITEVRTAASGAEALQMLRERPAHVLMTSMHLKDMTGVQLARSLHADPALASIGFLLTTSESDQELVAELNRTERTILMPKPFDLPRLSRALAEAAGPA